MYGLLTIMAGGRRPAPVPPTPTLDWFYVEDASGAANTVSITKNNTNAPTLTIETSTDGNTWTTLGNTDTTPLDIQVSANGKVYVRCTADSWGNNDGHTIVSSTGDFNVGGNIMSLLYGSNFTGNETAFPSGSRDNFALLFYNATRLVNASNLVLPATTLTYRCYYSMFDGCTALTTAPATLPATTLTERCYHYMFRDCTSLTTAPALPATTLATYSCYGMFQGCTALTTAPTLNATTLAYCCCASMFYGCTSLTTAPATLPATTLAMQCYANMFQGCSALTTAPELPATTLADGCYASMFRECTALTTAPALPATTLATYCYDYMFRDCTSLTTAPELPAATLAGSCYECMFRGCTSLNSVTCLATDITATYCTAGWVDNVAATGTFYKASSMSSWTTGNSGIPSGWTVLDA